MQNRNSKAENGTSASLEQNGMLAAYPLEVAQKIAVDICYKLQPFCEKINIAGSVRRKKPEVKDIEIVCVPKQETQYDMFGTPFTSGRSRGLRDLVLTLGRAIKGSSNGKYMQIELPQGINLDLFMPDDFDYYRQYAIRTGSADYAAKIIATGWKKKGWCGSNKGLRKISDCIEIKGSDGKSKWKCVKANAELPPVWQSEEQFFEWLGIKYLPPNLRNI